MVTDLAFYFDYDNNKLNITIIKDLIYWVYDPQDGTLILVNLYNPKYDQPEFFG